MPTIHIGKPIKALVFNSKVAIKWFVTQLDQSTGLLHRELGVRVSPGQQWMNSSTAEQRLVKPPVESSNLSSSAFACLV